MKGFTRAEFSCCIGIWFVRKAPGVGFGLGRENFLEKYRELGVKRVRWLFYWWEKGVRPGCCNLRIVAGYLQLLASQREGEASSDSGWASAGFMYLHISSRGPRLP